jgi:hypothetical protein
MKHAPRILLVLVTGLLITGCDEEDERLAEFAQQSTAQQAQQNRSTAELARDATENQRQMVESVEKSRQDLAGLHETLAEQRTSIDEERRDLTNERHRESLLAPVLSSIGLLMVTSLPLVLCWYLLRGLSSEPVDDSAVSRVLIQELVAEQPLLLPPARQQCASRIEHTPTTTDPVTEPPF